MTIHRIASQPQKREKKLIVMNSVSLLTTMTTKNMETVTKISTDNVAEIKLKFMLIDRKMRCTFVDQVIDCSKYVHTKPTYIYLGVNVEIHFSETILIGWISCEIYRLTQGQCDKDSCFHHSCCGTKFLCVHTQEEYSIFSALTRSNHLVIWYNKMRKTK